MSIKAIIWDFGNVIALYDYSIVTNRLAKMTNNVCSEQMVREMIFDSGLLDNLESGKSSSEEFLQQLRDDLPLGDASDSELALAWSDMFSPNDAAIGVINRLPADIRLVLGSTTNGMHFEFYRQRFKGVLDRFDEFVLSHKVGCVKPAEKFYQACLVAAQCKPSECLYLDDIPGHIDGARELGIDGVVYSPEVDVEQALMKRKIPLRVGQS